MYNKLVEIKKNIEVALVLTENLACSGIDKEAKWGDDSPDDAVAYDGGLIWQELNQALKTLNSLLTQ